MEKSRKPSVMAPVSLMFFSVPVSSCAIAGPVQNAAASRQADNLTVFHVTSPLKGYR